jgi:hypothetical protein
MAMNQAGKGSIKILPKALFFVTIIEAPFVVAARSSSVMNAHASNVVSYSNRDTKANIDALIDLRSVQISGQEVPVGKVMILGLIEWIKPEEKKSGIGYLDKNKRRALKVGRQCEKWHQR